MTSTKDLKIAWEWAKKEGFVKGDEDPNLKLDMTLNHLVLMFYKARTPKL